MDNQLSYYRDLLKKWLAGDISEAEGNELFDFIRNEPQRANSLLKESEGAEYTGLIKPQRNLDPAVSDRMRARLLQAMNSVSSEAREQVPVHSISPKRKRFTWAAAAAILILVFGAGYLYIANKNENPNRVAKAPLPADVPAPKSNRATVTLASGKTIFLDSSATGELAVQGKTTLKKIADGDIAYAVEKNPGAINAGTETTYNTLTNPRGSRVISLTLSDGTKVWLNAESSLHYPTAFNGGSRQVEITGEGYFEVKQDAAKPFIVKKGDMNVTVLGTRFNVNAYDDEENIKVTLLEGSVRVTERQNTKLLTPGQQAVLNQNTESITIISPDPGQVMAWKEGWFEFDNTRLIAIMQQVSRWYDLDIVYENEPSRAIFGGRIGRKLSLSAVLEMLEQYKLGFRLEGKKLYVRS